MRPVHNSCLSTDNRIHSLTVGMSRYHERERTQAHCTPLEDPMPARPPAPEPWPAPVPVAGAGVPMPGAVAGAGVPGQACGAAGCEEPWWEPPEREPSDAELAGAWPDPFAGPPDIQTWRLSH